MANLSVQRWLILCVMLALTAGFAVQVMVFDHAFLYGENELMEHVQLFILAVVGYVFFAQGRQPFWQAVPALRLLTYAVALCVSFIVREMSVKATGIDWLIFIVDGQGFKLLMVLMWLPLLVKAFAYRSQYFNIVKQAIVSPTALYLMAAIGCLLAGALFDKEIIVVEYFRFYEEVLEMNGYGFMLVAAIHFHKDVFSAACDNCLGEIDDNCYHALPLQ